MAEDGMEEDETPTMIIIIVDKVPDCNNPSCDNEAIGVIVHPVLGVVATCGECLEMINRVDQIVRNREAVAQFN